jgi:hypothetical protein
VVETIHPYPKLDMTPSRFPRRFVTRRTAVTDWKSYRDALVDEGMAFAKVVPGEAPAKDFVERLSP